MSIDPDITRRALLVAGAGTAGAAVLAACSSADDNTSKAAPGAGGTTQPAVSPASSRSVATGASSSSAAAAAGGGKTLAALGDIRVGSSTSVTLADGKPAIVTRTATNSVVCLSAICTHEGCTVKPAGRSLDCPCHGSQFNAATGAVLAGPAPSPLPRIAVEIEGGNVVAT